MGKPFEVEIDCGSANPVRFTLDEARIRSAGIKVQYALLDDQGDPDERTRLWRGALTIARNVLERNSNGPIEIYDGPDVWVIPESSVRWVRLHDPESARTRTEMGFRVGDSGAAGGAE
jgi:hypothetical protein